MCHPKNLPSSTHRAQGSARSRRERNPETHRMYMMTPRDHMSQDLSYFSGPSTSGAAKDRKKILNPRVSTG